MSIMNTEEKKMNYNNIKKMNARTVKVIERKKKNGRVLIYGCTWIDIEWREEMRNEEKQTKTK